MRKLYYDDQFARQLSELELHVPRIREFLRGLASKLKRNPEFGTQVRDNPPVWFAGMPDLIEQPLGVLYTFDDTRVVLLSIWIDEGCDKGHNGS